MNLEAKNTLPEPDKLDPGHLASVRSGSSERTYEIVVGKDHAVYCTCPGWKFSKPSKPGGKTCKHLNQFMEDHPVIAHVVAVYKSWEERVIFG